MAQESRGFFNDYKQTQSSIRNLFILFLSTIIAVLTVSMGLIFYIYTYQQFDKENRRLREDYINLQKETIKNRVDQACAFIEHSRKTAEEKLRDTLKERANTAYQTANFIYEKYKDKESEASIKQRIKDALEMMRYENGNSYIWIMNYDHIAVLAPTNKQKEGSYIGDFVDGHGSFTIKNQARTAKEKKEGFAKDYYSKPNHPKDEKFQQISFVKDFGHFGWYFGTAAFLDDFEKKIQNDVIASISKMAFGTNYIFIDTFDGYALSMNGEKLDKPLYSWELTDKNGVKILQEQLKAAKSSPQGGYTRYVWHEKKLNKDMEHLSFSRTVDDWKWKVGTGVYIGKIEEEIEKRTTDFDRQMQSVMQILGVIFAISVLFSIAVAFTLNARTKKLFFTMSSTIDRYYQELTDLNKNLEKRVEEETKKRVEQEGFLIQQSKMAVMGEMIDSIAHQWKQPLTNLSLMIQDICYAYSHGIAEKKDMDEFKSKAMSTMEFMTTTINDFRNFFSPQKNESTFLIGTTVDKVTAILAEQLQLGSISVEKEIDSDISVTAIENEIKQLLLNIINNAKEVLLENGVQNPKITIKAEKLQDKVHITISDNGGQGIPQELLPTKIFDHRISTKEGGSGLGLWMSRMIAEKHRGCITARNGEDGAIFEVELPSGN